MSTISVIVLNYNSSADCCKCVADLQRQEGVELEIIIVDNCSRKEDASAVEQLAAEQGCTFIAAKENRGYNAGNNIGLRYAAEKGYEYALITNPDMEFPQRDYVRRLIEEMEARKEVAVAATDITSPDLSHQNPMMPDPKGWQSSFNWVKVILKRSSKETPDFIGDFKTSHVCKKVSGCCLMVRMDFIKRIGFFDEQVFLYCEEAILSKQVEQAGLKMYYVANLQAVHRHVKSTKGNPRKRFKAWISSRLYFERHYNYQGFWNHFMKTIGWKSYLAVFCTGDYVRSIMQRNKQ